MSSSSAATGKRVLIVGGGPGGQGVAQELQKLNKSKGSPWQITLLFHNAFVETPMWSGYYTSQHEEFHRFVGPQDVLRNKSFGAALAGINLRVGQAVGVEAGALKVRTSLDAEGEESLPFDVLAIATGNNFGPLLAPKPLQPLAERAAEVALVSRTLAKARKCIVIGGGAVGVKVAGDYKQANPECEVILACRSSMRVTNWDATEHEKLREVVAAVGIMVVEDLGELQEPELPTDVAACCAGFAQVRFASGRLFEDVGLLVPGYAQGLNTGFLPSEYLVQGKSGRPIATNEYGQSVNDQRIFGVGPIASSETDFPGVPRYMDGTKLWALNMAAVLEGESPAKDLSKRGSFKSHRAPFNQAVGHRTAGVLAPRHAPMMGALCQCCGFPFLPLCCPCFCPCPFVCGWCGEAVPAGTGRGLGSVFVKKDAAYAEGSLPGVAPGQAKMA